MATPIQCGQCRKPYAATFAHCPHCNHPTPRAPDQPGENAQPAAQTQPDPRGTGTARKESPAEVAARAKVMARAMAGPARRGGTNRQLGGWLIRFGAVCLVVGGALQGCQMTCARTLGPTERSVDQLLSQTQAMRNVIVSGAFVQWSKKVKLDLAEPQAVDDTADIVARQKELLGRVVEISASGMGALVMRSRRISGRFGKTKTVDLNRPTRVYTPLEGSAMRVWALSPPLKDVKANDPRALSFMGQSSYSGTLRYLKDVVDIAKIRRPSNQSTASVQRGLKYSRTPRTALAIVARKEAKPVVAHFAPLMDTGDKLWVVSSRETENKEVLEGSFAPCPSRTCRRYQIDRLEQQPSALLVVRAGPARYRPSPLSPSGIVLLVLGLGLIVLGIKL